VKKHKISKTQDKGIVKTQCSQANYGLKNQLQRLGVLLLAFHKKQMPQPPFHMEKETRVKVGFKE
jgi:hypothetical protein